tara:strand:- start:2071 stop:2493 length:423 start_codon:yes stop_codon:yes gene_type:complete
MKLMRYNHPNYLLHDLDSILSSQFRNIAPQIRSNLTSASSKTGSAVEWFEDDNHFFARIELPGVKREHLNVNVDDGLVRLVYERSGPVRGSVPVMKKGEQVLRIPDGVKPAATEAKLEDGILELTFPKVEESKPVKIEIQ